MDVPSRVEVEAGKLVVLTWEDGASTSIPARTLRAACLCADCRSEPGAARKEAVLREPHKIRISGASMVGAYAVSFSFEPDSHRTGIFSFEQLHGLGSPETTTG